MKSHIIGIDEVGRGALAGPVVVAAALVAGSVRFPRALGKLRDSKKLSPKQREAWFAHFADRPEISFAVARVYPRGVERMNISRAANMAAGKAYRRLVIATGARTTAVFLDGGLFIGNAAQPRHARTVVKGDETIKAVAIASIIAKVTRDRYMVRLARRHPAYGLDVHKGYGTTAHRAAIRKHGPTPVHRATFLKGAIS